MISVNIALLFPETIWSALSANISTDPATTTFATVSSSIVFLMRLSRFLGLYPNLEDYHTGDYFDLLNACFTSIRPQLHSSYINPEEAVRLRQLMRMNYETMHLFGMSRAERTRCLTIMNDYYRLHLPDFPALKSLEVLKELFD